MKPKLNLKHAIESEVFDRQYLSKSIRVGVECATRLVTELGMLKFRLVDQLDIVGSNACQLELKIIPEGERSVSPYIEMSGAVALPKGQIDFVMAFLLKYIRDRIGDVDHIDIALWDPGSGAEQGSFTVKIESARAPISGDEARRILGL